MGSNFREESIAAGYVERKQCARTAVRRRYAFSYAILAVERQLATIGTPVLSIAWLTLVAMALAAAGS